MPILKKKCWYAPILPMPIWTFAHPYNCRPVMGRSSQVFLSTAKLGDNVLGSVLRPSVRPSVLQSTLSWLNPQVWNKNEKSIEESLSVRGICLCVDYLARMRSIVILIQWYFFIVAVSYSAKLQRILGTKKLISWPFDYSNIHASLWRIMPMQTKGYLSIITMPQTDICL